MRKGNWVGLLTVIALLVIALPGCMPGEEEANAQSAAINDVRAKADSNAGQISGLTGRVGALEARATGEVSAASFAALQTQVNGLQTTIGAQEARIAELEAADTDSGTGGTGTDTGDILAETRWRPQFEIDFDLPDSTYPTTAITVHREYEPRTIKEPGVYTFTIDFKNPDGDTPDGNILLCDVTIDITLTPSDKVMVSDTSMAYDIESPSDADVWWETNVSTSASTGICRHIQLQTESFSFTVADGATETVEVEFELVYE